MGRGEKRKRVVPNESECCAIREKKHRDNNSTHRRRKLLRDLPSIVSRIMSDDSDLQLQNTSRFSQASGETAGETEGVLFSGNHPPIDKVIESGVIPQLIQFLNMNHQLQLQRQAARVLKNIAAENAETLVECSAIPALVKLLESSDDEVVEQAICALGNMATDTPKFREIILRSGALHPLLKHLNEDTKLSLLRSAVRTLANFCDVKPQPPVEKVAPAVPVIASLLLITQDEQVLAEACWALSYLFQVDSSTMDLDTFSTAICPKLIELLSHQSPTVVFPAILALYSTCCSSPLVQRTIACRAYVILSDIFWGKLYNDCVVNAASVAYKLIVRHLVTFQNEKVKREECLVQHKCPHCQCCSGPASACKVESRTLDASTGISL